MNNDERAKMAEQLGIQLKEALRKDAEEDEAWERETEKMFEEDVRKLKTQLEAMTDEQLVGFFTQGPRDKWHRTTVEVDWQLKPKTFKVHLTDVTVELENDTPFNFVIRDASGKVLCKVFNLYDEDAFDELCDLFKRRGL